jgi:hypothetical protein
MAENKLEQDSKYIKSAIESNIPFFIGRIAGCELQIAYNFLKGDFFDIVTDMIQLENNAGIRINNNDSLKKYVEKLIESYEHCTAIAEWDTSGKVFSHTGQGQHLITSKTPRIPKINALSLEPYYFKEQDSWMGALKGKKILVVHPFASTFKRQKENLKKIFPGRLWFEDCELHFIEPPLTLAGNHQNKCWQEHYDIFIEKLKGFSEKNTFDVALVAAGGYGMLISDYIFTELNKSVIYLGGALQLFFGVIGKRWFDNKEIMKLVNDDWIRPSKEDKPPNFTNVEKGCYW